MMRRTLLKTFAAALVAMTAGFASAQPRDSVTLGMALEPPNLDPTTNAAQAIREVTLYNVYEGLVRMDRRGALQPLLAERWTVSQDGLTYTFTLRQGVRFHNNVAFDASIVRFSFERAMAPDSTNPQKWIFDPIESLATPDANTVVIRLKRPTATFLFGLAWGDAAMYEPSSVANNRNNPVGTGPFRFTRWVRGERVELEKFDGYWNAASIRLRRVAFRFMSDPQAQMAAMRSGDIDGMSNFSVTESVDLFRRDPRFAVVTGNTEGETLLAMNNGKVPYNDVRVRRAISHAINRADIIQGAMSGFGTPIGSHFSPNHPAYVDLTGTYPHDVARARALLAEAGHPNGFAANLRLPPPAYARRSGEIVAAQLAQVGIRVTIEPIEFAQWLDQVFRRRDYDLTIISHTEPLDIQNYAREVYYFNYQSPEFRSLMSQIIGQMDEERRNAMFGEAQRILARDAVNVWLFQLPKIGLWNANLQGLWENWPLPVNPLGEVSWR
jgi:peptide/nickel transport system substrate-binding protein